MVADQHALDRRRFLRTVGAVTAGTVAATQLPGAAASAAPAQAAPARAAAVPDGAAVTAATLSQGDFYDRNPRWVVKPFGLDQVELLDGTLFAEKRDRILNLLRAYPADRVLHNFRVTAGLPLPEGSTPPGGWDDATGNLRGHYSGHLLTGFAQAYASTGDSVYGDKVDYIVAELAACQTAMAASGKYSHPGFLAAYPEDQFVRLESFATYPTIWAPYYTCHKIMRGLLDAYLLAGNAQALTVVTAMGDWVHSRLSVLPRETLNRMWAIYIAGEYGGMNEVMADLHAITGDPKHLATAKCFDNRQSLFDACVEDRDIITRLHANTHVPQFVGYLRVFDQGAEETYHAATENFWHMVVPHRMYAHGGTSGTWPATPDLPANTNAELFQPRGNIAGSIAGNGAETCTSYNLLKVARNLFFHDPDPAYMEYYERTLLNHILGSKRDTESASTPNVTYFLPLTPGSTRGYGNTGTCCGGSGLENHTKYQESVYFRSADNSTLYVNLYVGSVLTWEANGFIIRQETDYPRSEQARLTVQGRGRLDIRLRVPGWAEGFSVKVNGVARKGKVTPGSYLSIQRNWKPGDTIEVTIPFVLRLEKALDDRDVQAIFNGPVLLPALGTGSSLKEFSLYRHFTLTGDLSRAVVPAGDGTFTTNEHTLRPLYVGDTQAQHVYFRRSEPAIVFGSHDSGVPNRKRPDGTSFLDEVWAAAPFRNHSQFMTKVSRTATEWVQAGLITRDERWDIVTAAGNAEDELGS
ncbi:beta-L-arabinofuranosidase domain-containing protein [Plantactinospora veratri]|uniref:Beta-L-arabinofuranosidase domain-containing protein n=1 Tax=Plantactinospora veratri TaxID=1436122 RepID=A0ABU7S8N5_9ACTN